MSWARAGTAYFAGVFVLAFALGVVRTLLVAPGTGDLVAVAVEVPVILAWAWWLCGRLIARFRVPRRPGARAAMGGVGFGLMMLAELALAITLGGGSPRDWLRGLADAAGMLGIAGQVAFGLLPLTTLAMAEPRS